MDLQEINRRHLFKTDFVYRKGFGLGSRLLEYKNGIIYLEVIFGRRWHKNYSATAYEIARCWKDHNEEFKSAIGCKVYLIDARRNPSKRVRYQKRLKVRYDARKGLLFRENILN